ncbi:TonB-dependent receptor [Marinicauda pacifica]|uniref:TonB-dependent receptor n=1 Tax=Marinicauda pacifica TaxID=1133559 RepID=A0A4S2HD64_9PROT|nr:TonB-dependent receptor [Marinicauda pacifica]TGY93997.1 TonB-dependent receptor [Marinicauda pacifica]GGE31996.1 TonB-dependent receptor [Marinicauda pacifica]
MTMRAGLLAGCASAVFLAGAAKAQEAAPDAAPERGASMDRIVVLGQKIENRFIEVDESVSVVGPEVLERQPVIDVYDVIERLPNVASSVGQRGFVIRGIDQRGAAASGTSNLALTVYVDDAALTNRQTFAGPLDVWDLEQIEVYRGPQSTNFGRNTLAGAIYARTRDPEFEYSARARASIAEYGTSQLAVAGGGGLVEDVLAFRISASHQESDGFITNTFLDEPADARELTTVRGKLLFQPGPRAQVLLTSNYFEGYRGDDGVIGFTDDEVFEREVAYNTPRREGSEGFIHSGRVTIDIADGLELVSITTANQSDYVRTEDFDVTIQPIAELDRSGEDDSMSQEVRFNVSRGALNMSAGGYYYDGRETYVDAFITPVSILDPRLPNNIFAERISDTALDLENRALFVDAEYAITDRLTLLAGLRYDEEESSFAADAVTRLISELPPGLEFLRQFEGEVSSRVEASYDAWLPKAGVQYALTPDINASFVVSRAYRAGGGELNAVTGETNVFDPEFMTNYEAGLKGLGAGGALQWAASVYYADWTDQQISQPAAPNVTDIFITDNAGESEIWGVELQGDYAFSDLWRIRSALGYAHTEFVDYQVFDSTLGDFVNVAGNRFIYAPEWTGSLALEYGAMTGAYGSVSANYTGSSYRDVENDPAGENDARLLVDLQAGWRWDQVALIGYVRNALDEEYTYDRNTTSGFARPGAPRVLGIRLDVDY